MHRDEEEGATVMRITIPDLGVSSSHARLQKVLGRWIVEDAGSKNGTCVDGRRVASAPLADGALLELGHTFLLYREVIPSSEAEFLAADALSPAAQGLATLSPPLAREFDRLAIAARSRIPIVVHGETGTGKEVIASAIHQLSRRPGPFVAVNCGALPAHLVESELFGYRKGAFSGAAEDRPGLLRSSHTGTLLLDEIGDLPLSAQSALLRVLQEEEVVAVGSTRPVKVDLRVVAATHRDVDALVAGQVFRADLLARLDGLRLSLPPLRERREDLGLLIGALLRKLARGTDVTFTADAVRALLLCPWPLNVRELEKCLAGALVLARGGAIGIEHLPERVRSVLAPAAPTTPAPRRSREEKERDRHDDLVTLLRNYDGNVTAVARAMGKARSQVQRWLRELHIDPLSFRH